MDQPEILARPVEQVVRVTGFVKRYGKTTAVQGVDLTVQRGEIYGLIGPDGAGKSSLMKSVAGVLSYEGGTVETFGITIDSESAAEAIKQRIGFLPQGLGLNLYPDLSVEENIDFFGRLRLVPEKDLSDRKTRLLAMTRLEKFRARAMRNLSGGMKQKLGLVCTLIHEPDLIILDEPTTGVDPVSRRDFWAILALLVQERRMTALVSTAYMDEAARFHRLSLLFEGRVLATGLPTDLHGLAPGSLVTVEASPQIEALARLTAHFPQTEAIGPALRTFVSKAEPSAAREQVNRCLDGLSIGNIRAGEPEIEDVFVALVRQQNMATALPPALPATRTVAHRNEMAMEAKELVRDFGSFRAVDHVSFQVKQGTIFGLLGANGAGKTTVIKMLTGLLPPSAGQGWVAGADMRTAGSLIKERIGYMSQAFSLYLDLTVVENIRLFAGIYGLSRTETEERLRWIVEMAGLDGYEVALVSRLPMGVRQRLALGCALVHRPRVLFLDEPTSGVDPIGRRRFWEILLRLAREEGVAILITTHYMGEAEHCDELALMFAGRIVSAGSPREMKQAVEQQIGRLIELVTDRPTDALAALAKAGVPNASLFGARVHVLSLQPDQAVPRMRDILAVHRIELRTVTFPPLSLEDVFVQRIMALEQQGREAVEGAVS